MRLYCGFDRGFAEFRRRGGIDGLGGGEVVHRLSDGAVERCGHLSSPMALRKLIDVLAEGIIVPAVVAVMRGDEQFVDAPAYAAVKGWGLSVGERTADVQILNAVSGGERDHLRKDDLKVVLRQRLDVRCRFVAGCGRRHTTTMQHEVV